MKFRRINTCGFWFFSRLELVFSVISHQKSHPLFLPWFVVLRKSDQIFLQKSHPTSPHSSFSSTAYFQPNLTSYVFLSRSNERNNIIVSRELSINTVFFGIINILSKKKKKCIKRNNQRSIRNKLIAITKLSKEPISYLCQTLIINYYLT